MKLEEYLEGLRRADEASLRKDFGISDNFPVFLNTDYEDFVRKLIESPNTDEFFKGRYELLQDRDEYRGTIRYVFVDSLKLAHFQVENSIASCDCFYDGKDGEHFTRQQRDFNINLNFHPNVSREEGNWVMAMRNIILDIANYALQHGVPLCLPQIETRLDHPEAIINEIEGHKYAALAPIYYKPGEREE
jgi:hypothetical protein